MSSSDVTASAGVQSTDGNRFSGVFHPPTSNGHSRLYLHLQLANSIDKCHDDGPERYSEVQNKERAKRRRPGIIVIVVVSGREAYLV